MNRKTVLLFSFLFCMCEASHVDTTAKIQEIVELMRTWREATSHSRMPFVTASFAQSLDGKMAPYLNIETKETTSNFPLSGDTSMLLTHAIRSIHDGILIGGRTLSIDNPRLTNRIWGEGLEGHQPRPIILDTHLTHLRKLGEACKMCNPIVCCSEEAASSWEELPQSVEIVSCRCRPDGKLDMADVLQKLYFGHGIKSIMAEGGAGMLTSLFELNAVDCLCVTISPRFLGPGSAPSFAKPVDLTISKPLFVQLGTDCILLSKWPTSQ